MKEVEGHIQTLQTLRSDYIGGPTGIICPPVIVTSRFPKDKEWPMISSSSLEKDFNFCHCDLSQSNIIVDPEKLTISGIIDWEFAGFFPSFFEMPFYKSPRPSGAQTKSLSETEKMIDFLTRNPRTGYSDQEEQKRQPGGSRGLSPASHDVVQ